jgi:hypothetical protein
MFDKIRRNLTRIGELTTEPAAFALSHFTQSRGWLFRRALLGWSAIATLAT